MMKAPVGSRFRVTGRRRAMVSAGPMPGRMPMRVPSVTPTSDHIRLMGVIAVAKPSIRARKESISEQSLQYTLWQLQAQTIGKSDIGEEDQKKSDQNVPAIT